MSSAQTKKDNAAYQEKLTWRQAARMIVRQRGWPFVVLEAFGGWGKLYQDLYTNAEFGMVLEENPQKAGALGMQRPTWRVYECKSEIALGGGLAADIPFTLVDLDPYGECWTTLKAFALSKRKMSDEFVVVCHDGGRNPIMMGRAWQSKIFAPYVLKYGNRDPVEHYLEVCEEIMRDTAQEAGFAVTHWQTAYGGFRRQSAHHLAVWKRM